MTSLLTKYLNEQVTLRNLPALRKAFIAHGLIIIFSFILAFSVAPVLIFLILISGFEILISGLIGKCMMERLIQKFSKNAPDEQQNFVQ